MNHTITTRENGPYYIFNTIKNAVDKEAFFMTIEMTEEGSDQNTMWSFGFQNFSDLSGAGAGLEGLLSTFQIDEAVLRLEENKNDMVLIYTIIFTRETTRFLTGEESQTGDSYDYETGEELFIPSDYLYCDSDFFKYAEDTFEPQTVDLIFEKSEENVPFEEVDLISVYLKKYNLKNKEELANLEISFLESIYGSHVVDLFKTSLDKHKSEFLDFLSKEPFTNDDNKELIYNFDKYFSIVEKIGLESAKAVLYALPFSDGFTFRVLFNNVDFADVIINLDLQEISYIEYLKNEEEPSDQTFSFNQSDIIKLKSVINERRKYFL